LRQIRASDLRIQSVGTNVATVEWWQTDAEDKVVDQLFFNRKPSPIKHFCGVKNCQKRWEGRRPGENSAEISHPDSQSGAPAIRPDLAPIQERSGIADQRIEIVWAIQPARPTSGAGPSIISELMAHLKRTGWFLT